MNKVYLLYHIHIDGEDEDAKLIGIYTSYELAEEAIERVKDKPGFIDFPEEFSIFSHELNRDGWVDGFVA